MPIFSTQLGKVESLAGQDAIKKIADHIRIIQEQLEYRLSYLDSSNISEIDTSKTNITTATGENINNVLRDTEGNISSLEQTAKGLKSSVESLSGSLAKYSTTEQTAEMISTAVGTALGDYSTTQQTAEAITTAVSSALGDYSTTEQTSEAISTAVSTALGDYSTTEQTAELISQTVSDQMSGYSTIQQTSDAIVAAIEDYETGMGTYLKMDANGVYIVDKDGNAVSIQGGQIAAGTVSANQIAAGAITADKIGAGAITADKISAGAITADKIATGAITIGMLPSSVAQTSDIPSNVSELTNDSGYQTSYGVTTIIGNTVTTGYLEALGVTASKLKGNEITLMDGNGYTVGTMSLAYSSTYAYDITSELSLRLSARSGNNIHIGFLDSGNNSLWPYMTMYQSDLSLRIGANVVLASGYGFGTALPSSGIEGQIFFVYSA